MVKLWADTFVQDYGIRNYDRNEAKALLLAIVFSLHNYIANCMDSLCVNNNSFIEPYGNESLDPTII